MPNCSSFRRSILIAIRIGWSGATDFRTEPSVRRTPRLFASTSSSRNVATDLPNSDRRDSRFPTSGESSRGAVRENLRTLERQRVQDM